ncbi:hypothetical protein OG592_27265 [Streptomyces avidinii]|uniref:hypothetical protein n=1 Tax=Streptomyces avidinii TaxID=1895 RepID=UPI0038699044|nr:hypothetical protein OG592_27265 [Streptomyces avidinii]
MTRTAAQRAAKAHNQRRMRRLMAYGQWAPMVDAEPARQHVIRLQRRGVALHVQSANTGVPVTTLCALLYGKAPYPPSKRIRTESAAALLAFEPTLDDCPAGARVDATGSIRRLRALATLGWTTQAISVHVTCVSAKTLEQLGRAGRASKVTAQLAREIRDFYAKTSHLPVPADVITPWIAERRRNHAARQGWVKPALWDDDSIDDPAAEPSVVERTPRYIALGEDCLELERLGHSRQQIAERLGVTRDGLQRALSLYRKTVLASSDMRKAA